MICQAKSFCSRSQLPLVTPLPSMSGYCSWPYHFLSVNFLPSQTPMFHSTIHQSPVSIPSRYEGCSSKSKRKGLLTGSTAFHLHRAKNGCTGFFKDAIFIFLSETKSNSINAWVVNPFSQYLCSLNVFSALSLSPPPAQGGRGKMGV